MYKQTGWVSVEGHFLPCDFGQHSSIIQKIEDFKNSKNPEAEAESKGWIKITKSILKGGWLCLYSYKHPNDNQLSFLQEWCRENDRFFPPQIEIF